MKSKKRKLIIGNWKMNPATKDEAKEIFSKIKRTANIEKNVKVVLCVPSIYFAGFVQGKKSNFSVGLQNIFYQNGGAFTGEVSPEMAKYSGAEYVIVGHSERREMGETDEIVSKKIGAVLKEGLSGIVCVGEKVRDENGAYLDFLKEQIRSSLSKVVRKNLDNLVVAYEPVWAIGKNFRNAMLPKDIGETIIFIKKTLADIFGQEFISKVSIVYGGSIDAENADGILSEGLADGLLVGRQSLDPEEFGKIIKIANGI